MMKSPYPLDETLGLSYYCTESEGIGGRLKAEPSDFIVEEIADYTSRADDGPYLICRLKKKNWDQQRAIREISNRLGMSHQRIGFAGTKDKRAVTTQFISIYKGDPAAVRALAIPDMTIEPVLTSQQQISLGDLQGNRFQITLTGIREGAAGRIREDLLPGMAEGIPNYYGYQRFGVTRPVTHLTGLALLKGEYEEAVVTFVSMPSAGEEEEPAAGRAFYRDTRDAKEALHQIPVRLSLERSLLHHLDRIPGDYAGAFHTFPRTLRSMFVSAVQSWLFNRTLSMRIADGRSLTEPSPGDRLIFPDGRSDQVTAATLKIAEMQVRRRRCRIALFMPGSEPYRITGPDDENMAHLMQEEGITGEMFKTASTFLETRFSGALRPVILQTEIAAHAQEDQAIFSFSLEPGQYATTVLREIMKADPVSMV